VVFKESGLAAGHDFDNLEAIAGLEAALREFRRRDGFTVMFDHDASGRKLAGLEEVRQGAGQSQGDFLAIGHDDRLVHGG